MKNKERWHRETIVFKQAIEKLPIPIVWDAAIANVSVADGKLLPLIIIDTSSRPDIEDMIAVHEKLGPGDVQVIWGRVSAKQKDITLWLLFKRPSECIVRLDFDIVKRGGIVDHIIGSEALYLQCGKQGDRLAGTFERNKIIIEVPSKSFRVEWDKILHEALEKDAQKKVGASKSQSREYSQKVVQEWRKLTGTRMKGG
jgi:hypothetical protein